MLVSAFVPRKKLTLCRDAEDNMLIECCLEAKAAFLVTGDKDLMEVENLPFRLTIVTPREYVETKEQHKASD